MAFVVEPFAVSISRAEAETFARAVALDDTRPGLAVPPTFPLTWLARPSILAAMPTAPDHVPVLVSHTWSETSRLAVDTPYRVTLHLDRLGETEGRFGLDIRIDHADGSSVARHQLGYRLVRLSAAAP